MVTCETRLVPRNFGGISIPSLSAHKIIEHNTQIIIIIAIIIINRSV